MCTHFMYSTSGREKRTDPYPGTAQCQRGSCSVHSAKQKKKATLKQRKKKTLSCWLLEVCTCSHLLRKSRQFFCFISHEIQLATCWTEDIKQYFMSTSSVPFIMLTVYTDLYTKQSLVWKKRKKKSKLWNTFRKD